MHKMCLKYADETPKIFQRYFKDMPRIFQSYGPWPRYDQDIHKNTFF